MIDHLLPNTPLTAPFNKLLQKLNLLRQKSISIRSTLSPLSQDAQKVINFSKDTQTAIQGIRQDLRTSLDDLHDDYETNIEPALRQVLNHTQDLSTASRINFLISRETLKKVQGSSIQKQKKSDPSKRNSPNFRRMSAPLISTSKN